MKLILMRHGPDARRGSQEPTLSQAGLAKVSLRAALLQDHVPSIDWCACSPAKRALETFRELSQHVPCKRYCISTALEPGQTADRLRGLLEQPLTQGVKVSLIVGHEPQLSQFYLNVALGPKVKLAQPWVMPQGDAFIFDYHEPHTLTFVGPQRPLQFDTGRAALF